MKQTLRKYGHELSRFSLRYPANMHAEAGAVIARHEFGLENKDALNAIKYHVSARPDRVTSSDPDRVSVTRESGS